MGGGGGVEETDKPPNREDIQILIRLSDSIL